MREGESGWQRRVEESKLSDGGWVGGWVGGRVDGWVGSGNGERNKKELAGTKRKPRLWGVVVVNPHLRVRSATTLPPVPSLPTPLRLLNLSRPLSLFLRRSRLLWRLPSFSVYISSFLKFLNIRSIGSRSLGKNWVGRHEMSAVGTAVSPSPVPPPPHLFPPARPVGVVSDKIYPYFIANATDALPSPPPPHASSN